jgi:raffinose/stachyose/melibiose transport system permease protein
VSTTAGPRLDGNLSPEVTTPSGDTPQTSSRNRRPRGWRPGRPHRGLYLFPVPALIIYTFFFAVPTIQAVQYAVTDWDGFSADFNQVGLGNFTKIVTGGDSLFTNALTNNLKFLLVVVILQTGLSLVLALLLLRNTKASVFVRSLYFLPTILSSVSVAFVWRFMYDPNFGLINQALAGVGLAQLQSGFLGDAQMAIYYVALTQVWAHAGQLMVIFIAGLQQIPQEFYEAAELDGVSRWQRFRFITWPLIAPTTAIVVGYTTIQSFKAFDLILGLGGNPPKKSLDILSTRIYTTFTNSEFGYAAAESLVFMVIIALVTVLQRGALRSTQRGV